MARATFSIRPGSARDAVTIVALIRELAVYERLLHEVKITPAHVRRHGFGPRSYFKTLICRRGRTPVGLALYFFTYSSFLGKPVLWLEDLLVLPAERGRGAGKALLKALAKIAVTRGCGRMEWSVLDWNVPAIRFYRRIGARLDKEWIITRLKDAPLKRLARSR
jgi:GNAT superfamily N-acetyltransferase